MKWFSVMVVIIWLTQGIINVSSKNIDSSTINCDEQLQQSQLQAETCAPRQFDMSDILKTINEYRRHALNGTEFSKSIIEYCGTLKSAVTCSMENYAIVSSTCPDHVKIQSIWNLIRFTGRIGDDLCSETIIYEIAGDTGFNCLNLRTLAECMHGKRSNQDVGMPLEDRNICQTAHRLRTCLDDPFEECQNNGTFKRYASQALSGVIQDFSCK